MRFPRSKLSAAGCTSTGEEWHICSFNAKPEAPAFFLARQGQAGASGWALNESLSTGSGIKAHGIIAQSMVGAPQ